MHTASRGNTRKAKRNVQGSSDIAVPTLDDNGNLQEQPDSVEDGSGKETESEEDDEEQDSDFEGPKGRSGGRNGAARSRRERGKGSGGRSATGRASKSRKSGPIGRKAAGNAEDDVNADEQIAAAEPLRSKDDFSVEADNNLYSELCFGAYAHATDQLTASHVQTL